MNGAGGGLPLLRIPDAIKIEHTALHARLARAARARGPVGRAARAVVKLLDPHFAREEKYALPPLGLLTLLSTGHVHSAMAAALPLTETLRAELPRILAEHQEITAAARVLEDAARKAKRTELAGLGEIILLQTQGEEEILYPACLLIGEYLKCKLKR